MDEMAHRECVARIKWLEEAFARSQADVDGTLERAEKAEGALQVAAAHNVELQEENDRLRRAVLNQCGDNLCHSDLKVGDRVQPPDRAEFLKSCERFIDQVIEERGSLGPQCMTISQLEARIAELEEGLRPFASEATEYPEASDRLLIEESDAITVGDLRRAARLVEGKD